MHVGSVGLKHRVLVKDDTVAALGDVQLEHSFAGCVGCILNRELERDVGSWIFIIRNLQVQWFLPLPTLTERAPKISSFPVSCLLSVLCFICTVASHKTIVFSR